LQVAQAFATERPTARPIDHEPGGGAVEPGRQRLVVLDELAVLPQADENLLNDVVCLRVSAEHSPAFG
jgi:hypothetical protein